MFVTKEEFMLLKAKVETLEKIILDRSEPKIARPNLNQFPPPIVPLHQQPQPCSAYTENLNRNLYDAVNNPVQSDATISNHTYMYVNTVKNNTATDYIKDSISKRQIALHYLEKDSNKVGTVVITGVEEINGHQYLVGGIGIGFFKRLVYINDVENTILNPLENGTFEIEGHVLNGTDILELYTKELKDE